MAGPSCIVCGKELIDLVSQQTGLDPDCRIAVKERSYRMSIEQPWLYSPMAAVFTFALVDGVICVKDSLVTGRKSLTNSVGTVLEGLTAAGWGVERLVIYRDGMGIWDRIAVRSDGTFDSFEALNLLDRREAVELVLKMAKHPA